MSRHLREGEDYDHQRPPFDMPLDGEQVVLPSGERLNASFARVFWLLFESARQGLRYHLGGHRYGAPGEVPTWVLRHMWAGGTSGDRRARQLSLESGLPIKCPGSGTSVGVYLYEGVFEGVSIRAKVARRHRPVSKPTAPRPSPSRMAQRLEERQAPASAEAALPSLGGVHVAVLWPHQEDPAAVALEVGSAIGPSRELVGDVESGLPPWEADDRYRRELIGRVRSGEALEQLRALSGRSVWCPRIGHWTPATALRAVVEALGARAA